MTSSPDPYTAARRGGPVRPGSWPGVRVRATAALCAARPEVSRWWLPGRRGTLSRASRAFTASGGLQVHLCGRAAPIDIAPTGGFSLGGHRNGYRPLVLLVCPSRGFRSKQVHGPVYASDHAVEHRPGRTELARRRERPPGPAGSGGAGGVADRNTTAARSRSSRRVTRSRRRRVSRSTR
jgi:hypothetical protein